MDRDSWIKKVEEHYGVRYVGFYDLPKQDNVWVFYQENPKTELGHTNYMGVFFIHDEMWVTNAIGITEAKYPAIEVEPGRYIVSRYRHNFVSDEKTGAFIDGGLAYTRSNRPSNTYMRVVDGKEIYDPYTTTQ